LLLLTAHTCQGRSRALYLRGILVRNGARDRNFVLASSPGTELRRPARAHTARRLKDGVRVGVSLAVLAVGTSAATPAAFPCRLHQAPIGAFANPAAAAARGCTAWAASGLPASRRPTPARPSSPPGPLSRAAETTDSSSSRLAEARWVSDRQKLLLPDPLRHRRTPDRPKVNSRSWESLPPPGAPAGLISGAGAVRAATTGPERWWAVTLMGSRTRTTPRPRSSASLAGGRGSRSASASRPFCACGTATAFVDLTPSWLGRAARRPWACAGLRPAAAPWPKGSIAYLLAAAGRITTAFRYSHPSGYATTRLVRRRCSLFFNRQPFPLR